MFSPVLVISVVLIAASAKSIVDESREEPETERIIFGKDAAPGQFPWVAALYYNDQFICTSSIISPTTVLTAAHCVILNSELQPADLYYAIANVNKSAQNVRIDFSSVTPHPEYDERTINNDVAVFKTTEPIQFNDEVKPICIAGPNTAMNAYRKATAMGWGNQIPFRTIRPVIPDNLQYAEHKVVDNRVCSAVNPGVDENKVCATGTFFGLNGVCNGDSGGPLVHIGQDQPPVEIGITSYINGLFGCGKVIPAVWTRVSSYYDFIMQTADDGSICTV